MKELKLEVKKLERRETEMPTCVGSCFGTCINASGIFEKDLLRVMLTMMGYMSPVLEACGL
jgi:hypothetical protein